eukprot:TRINITY_DN8833_c0_g1_i1.p1 TRINITY_DN8833_c0_g1~~TRINITY_DN8833_c0_g1_i1.p1  ORF type:complete len:191 (-),score=37.31 TRINITY_DN8833_c0_g1_i1:283-855(-)
MKTKLELMGVHEMEFDKVADLPECDLKRGTVALGLHLRHLPTKRELLCVNTHIFWNHKFNQIKYAQMSYLLREISAIVDRICAPALICGDLNVWPDSNVIRLLYGLEPKLTYSDITTEEHKKILKYFWESYGAPLKNMRSAYDAYQDAMKGKEIVAQEYERAVKGHPEYTCLTFDEYETLDYILYDKQRY